LGDNLIFNGHELARHTSTSNAAMMSATVLFAYGVRRILSRYGVVEFAAAWTGS